MMRKIWRKTGVFLITAAMLTGSLAACGKQGEAQTSASGESGTGSEVSSQGREKVTFWHLWTGDEAEYVQDAVDAFNESQDKYFVEATSTPDSQKIMIAIQAGNGPDITDDFTNNVANYASMGVMEPLDDYIERDGYDIDDFIPAALEACQYDGKQYALPCNVNLMALYYNKTLLKEAGYDKAPETMEEMYQMAVDTTKVNDDGTIDTLGWVEFPSVYYLSNMITSCGGGWYTDDAKPSNPDSEGNKLALQMSVDYRNQFGLDNVAKFQSSGKYGDPTDPFLQNKQALRIDGSWLGSTIEKAGADVDYGVTYLPYPQGHEELAKTGLLSASTYYIPSNAKNKEGAWEFLKFLVGPEGQSKQILAASNVPSRLSLLESEQFKGTINGEFFSEMGTKANLKADPNVTYSTEYNTIINEEVELCQNLKQTPEECLQKIYERASEIAK